MFKEPWCDGYITITDRNFVYEVAKEQVVCFRRRHR